MKKRKIAPRGDGIAKMLIKGVLIFALLYTALTLALTVGAYMSENPTGHTRAFSLAALLSSGLVGGLLVGRRSGEKICTVSALVFSILVMTFGAVLSRSAPGIGNTINYLIYIGIAFAASKIKLGGRRKIRHR